MPARRRQVQRTARAEVDAGQTDLAHLKVADTCLGDEVEPVEAVGRGVGAGEFLRLEAAFEGRFQRPSVERGPGGAVGGTGERPLLRVALRHVVGTRQTVGRDRDSVGKLDLPPHLRTGPLDAPLGARVAVVRLVDILRGRAAVRSPRSRDLRTRTRSEGDDDVAEVPVRAEAGHAGVEIAVRLAREGVVVVVDTAPQALFVELDALLVGIGEEHGTESAVADRQGLRLPVQGGYGVGQRLARQGRPRHGRRCVGPCCNRLPHGTSAGQLSEQRCEGEATAGLENAASLRLGCIDHGEISRRIHRLFHGGSDSHIDTRRGREHRRRGIDRMSIDVHH
ncbi:hypothetical protein SPURM210S_01540 [Streptomyces purpurascens]